PIQPRVKPAWSCHGLVLCTTVFCRKPCPASWSRIFSIVKPGRTPTLTIMPEPRTATPMTPNPHDGLPDPGRGAATPAVPAAVAAFLRGIERRGAVLAELQCGDPQAGDAALAAAMRAFRAVGPAEAMARWPIRFWNLLLATP